MTQLTPEERERVLDDVRDGLISLLRLELGERQHRLQTGAYREKPWIAGRRRTAQKLIRRIRALDQLRAESGLIEKLERLLRAGWRVDAEVFGGVCLVDGRGRELYRPTLTAALKSAPEPER